MEAILEVQNLVKIYGVLTAVDSISFQVYKGEIFGFLGPNGAGKTTTIKMMCGLIEPDRGKVVMFCNNTNKFIGVCPQNIVIWENLTCYEQLVYMAKMYEIPSNESQNKANELLESLGLSDKKNILAKTLSGGMQRRLSIALALIHSPAIVFLDEPQAGLDPQSRVLVRDYIKSIKKETTVILSTHDMDEAEKLSDRVCIIDKGKILAIGTTDEIKKTTSQKDLIEISINGNIQNEILSILINSQFHSEIITDNCAHIFSDSPYSVLEEILAVANKNNVKINNLRLSEKSLEDIFINLTGRSLRE